MAYIGTSPSNGVRRVLTYTATANQTTFTGTSSEGITLTYSDGNYVDVYQNGVLLGTADYTATSGTSIVLGTGASVNDIIVIIVYDVFSVADTVSQSAGGTFEGNVTMAGTLGVTGAITGTLATASQPNITSVGTLTSFRSTGIDDNANALAMTIDANGNILASTGTITANRAGADQNILGEATTAGYASRLQLKAANYSGGSYNGIQSFQGDATPAWEISGARANATNQFKLFTGGTLVQQFESNRMTVPLQPIAVVEKTTATSVGSGQAPVVVFNEVRRNQGSMYNTSNGRFTAPVAGNYIISAELQANGQYNQFHVGIYLNGGAITPLDVWINFGDNLRGATRTLSLNLSAGDYLTVNSHFGSNSATLEAQRCRATFYMLG